MSLSRRTPSAAPESDAPVLLGDPLQLQEPDYPSPGRNRSTWAIVTLSGVGALTAAFVATVAFSPQARQLFSVQQSDGGGADSGVLPVLDAKHPNRLATTAPDASLAPSLAATDSSDADLPTQDPIGTPGTRPQNTVRPTTAPGGTAPPPGNRIAADGPTVAPGPGVPVGIEVPYRVLERLNDRRAALGLDRLHYSSALLGVGNAHNERMATGCGLKDLCSGEASLSSRVSAAGVGAIETAQNVALDSTVAVSDQAAESAANAMIDSMLAEEAGGTHRTRLVSAKYRQIGLALYRDSQNRLWMTQVLAS